MEAAKPKRVLQLVGESPKTPAGFLAEDSRVDHQTVAWMLQAENIAPIILRECVVIRLFLPNCTDGVSAPDADRNLACIMMRDFSRVQTEAYFRLVQVATWSLVVQQHGDSVDHVVHMANASHDGAWVEDRVGGIARRAFALRQPRGCPVGVLYKPAATQLKLIWLPTPTFGRSVCAELLNKNVEEFSSGALMTFLVRLCELYPLWGMLPPR